MKKAGLYIHFPFCRRSCFYCHFFKKAYDKDLVDRYIKYLLEEIRLRKNHELALDTVYVGGGSPSLLKSWQLQSILESVTSNFHLAANAEITLEANPEDVSAQELRIYRSLGVNRLSLGVQSFQESDLSVLKRTHTADQAYKNLTNAIEAGFANISIDLIIGLETQTPRSLENNFKVIEKFMPPHLSVYILEGVPSKRPPRGGVPSKRPPLGGVPSKRPPLGGVPSKRLPLGGVPSSENDDRDAGLYFHARASLLTLGYQHYEVSNYCLPGKASRHNLKYWQNQPYIGLGASAAGYLDGRDYKNFPDLKKYFAALDHGLLPKQKTAPLRPALRRVITGLRLLDGIPASAFKPFPDTTDFLLTESFLVRHGRNLAVPPEKILLLNEILGYFI